MTHTKDEALALEALILKTGMNPVMQGICYVMHPEALQAVIDEAIKQALAAPVQEPYCFFYVENGEEYFAPKGAYVPDNAQPLYTTPPSQPAPVQPIIGSYLEKDNSQFKFSDYEPDGRRYPAVPDSFGTSEGEHPQYIQGWNDCRAEMLKGMKS